jgi:hypothetical protein
MKVEDIPHEVLAFKLQQYCGVSQYEYMLKTYPEHFKYEIKKRDEWNAIPKEVKDMAFKEEFERREALYKSVPHQGKGIMFYIDNPKEEKEYREALAKISPELERVSREVDEKYFGPYRKKK